VGVKSTLSGGKKLALAIKSIADKVEKGGVLRVGFLEGATYPAGDNSAFLKAVGSKAKPTPTPSISVAQVAFWNEFGTVRAPARPFFRTTIAKESGTWGENLGKAVAYYKYDGELALRALGQAMRDDVEASIQRWATPGNAPLTIKIKGFDKPLMHTAVMLRSPDFEVVAK
jgi:hypothetical protein